MFPIILYNNLLLKGTLTATYAASGFEVANIADWRSYTLWKSTNTATQYITVDIGSSYAADSVGFINHNLGSIGATVTVEYWNGSAWVDCGVTLTPADDRTKIGIFTERSGTKWRLKIAGISVEPEIGILVICKRLEFPCPPEAPYDPDGEGIVANPEVSKQGHLLGVDVRYYPIETQLRFPIDITRTWYNTYFVPFKNVHGRLLKPFLFAWDLTACPGDIYLYRFKASQKFTRSYEVLAYVNNVTLDLEGIAE